MILSSVPPPGQLPGCLTLASARSPTRRAAGRSARTVPTGSSSVIPACHTPNGWRRCPCFPACAGRAKRLPNLRKSGLTPSVCSEVADRGHLSPQCLRLAFLIHGDPKWVLRTAAAAHVGRSTSSTARLVSVSRLLWSPDTDCTLSQTPDPVLRLANATHSSIWRDEARHVAKRDPRQR